MRDNFHDDYLQAVALLPEFGTSLKSLLERLLAAEAEKEQLRVHEVCYRVKTEASAARKAARPRHEAPEAGPRPFGSLTDLLGIRVITYFRDEVDVVAKIIEREFIIDQENSVDTRALLDPDRFGYLSPHYVAELSPGYTAMPEFQKYDGIRFEIQIRSILQHAWAEIERDLGYRSTDAMPRAFHRRFSRLAGLLELADHEFADTRSVIGDHKATAKETIEQGRLGREIDQDSLSAFVRSSPQIASIDTSISRILNATVRRFPDEQFLGRMAAQLREQKFNSIQDLSNYLDEYQDLLPKFVKHWLELVDQVPSIGRASVPVPAGITLWYIGKLKYSQALPAMTTAGAAYPHSEEDRLRKALLGAVAE